MQWRGLAGRSEILPRRSVRRRNLKFPLPVSSAYDPRRVFCPEDFVILRRVGSLSASTSPLMPSLPSDDALGSSAAVTPEAINLYSARYRSGLPNEPEVQVLLKEFPGDSQYFARNALSAYSNLILPSLDGQQNEGALAQLRRDASQRTGNETTDFTHVFSPEPPGKSAGPEPPFAPLLGSFISQPATPSADSTTCIWLVQRWTSLQPISSYPTAEQVRFTAAIIPNPPWSKEGVRLAGAGINEAEIVAPHPQDDGLPYEHAAAIRAASCGSGCARVAVRARPRHCTRGSWGVIHIALNG